MRICFFGIYDRAYSRNSVLMEGFRRLGHEVIECRVNPRAVKGLRKYFALYRAYQGLGQKKFDHVIVAFPGQSVVWLARILFGPYIIFDAFVSLYDSNVYDRKRYLKWSFFALRDWLLDWYSTALASRVLFDTGEHIRYFQKTFGLPEKKCIRVFLGTNDKIFFPQAFKEPVEFTVHFHGTYIPLQGIEYIVEAARLLSSEPIRFRILGSGQESGRIKDIVREVGVSNIEFVGRVPLEELPKYIGPAQVVLGIFGSTSKTTRVIPNKVYEALAMGKAVITADTSAVRELLTHKKDVFLIPPANPKALADAIMTLWQDTALRSTLERGSRETYLLRATPEKVVQNLLALL